MIRDWTSVIQIHYESLINEDKILFIYKEKIKANINSVVLSYLASTCNRSYKNLHVSTIKIINL